MDFAKKQLEKYGWKEGDGLGKEGNEGITKAIKPRYKMGKAGMGFDLAKELTDTWWTRSYDASLKAVNVENDADSGSVTVSGADSSNPAKDVESEISRINKRFYSANFREFSKGGTLDQGKFLPDSDSGSDDDKAPKQSKISQLTDEQLLKACGGRTAHKGARHGFKLSGKLKRLAAQDAYLLAKAAQTDPEIAPPELKRTKKSKESKKSKRSKKSKKSNVDLVEGC